MQIVFILSKRVDQHSGGVERVTYIISQELLKRGYRLSWVVIEEGKDFPDETAGPIPQYFLPVHRLHKDEFISRLRSITGKDDAPLYIFQGIQQGILKMLGWMPEGSRKVLFHHNQPFALLHKERLIKRLTPFSSLRPKGKLLKILAMTFPSAFRRLYCRKIKNEMVFIANHVDRIVFLSGHFIEKTLGLCPEIEREKLDFLYNPNTFEAGASSGGEKENIVLFVGRLTDPQKNVTGFIDVWSTFSKTHPHWKAYVVGSGEHEDKIKRYAAGKGVKNLEFTGRRSDVASFYSRAKLYCMTSTFEGWGMVLTEAMAYGCVPVVYDSYEAAKEIVDHDVNGILVEAFNAGEMAAALSRLADDEDLRIRMEAEGMKKIDRYTVDKIVDDWEKKILRFGEEHSDKAYEKIQ